MNIDIQIQQALIDAEIKLLKQDRLRELNLKSAEIKMSMGKRTIVMSNITRQKLLALIIRKI